MRGPVVVSRDVVRLTEPGLGEPSLSAQEVTTRYFDDHVEFWDDVYVRPDVFSVIHQERRRQALALIDDLALDPGTTVLEIGCGSGRFAVALAARGFQVDAVDASDGMVQATRRRAHQAGLDGALTSFVGDVHQLEAESERYSLVVALGVVPWIHCPPVAIEEMARVLQCGGHLLVSADNRSRLTYQLDPRFHPLLEGPRKAVHRWLAQAGRRPNEESVARPALHSAAELQRWLSESGLELVARSSFGFGPFTILGRSVLPTAVAIRVHERLQRWAARPRSRLRSRGTQLLVLARKAPGQRRGEGA
jgi:ubiquinone/menaquinone biosynthesis C-methylase UbiE